MNGGRPVDLRVVPEREALPETSIEALRAGRPPAPGAFAVTRFGGHLPASHLAPLVEGRIGGAPDQSGSAREYLTWPRAKLDSIEPTPSTWVSLSRRNAS